MKINLRRAFVTGALLTACAAVTTGAAVSSFYDLKTTTLLGQPADLGTYRGKVTLVVNVASFCGYTPQYQGLEKLHRELEAKGFAVLGFPSNDFGEQEPGTAQEIAQFCKRTYDVTFPMFAKVEVNGPNAHPLYQHLKSASPGVLGTEGIKWNFTKFLVDGKGEVVKRYGSVDTPAKIEKEIEALL